MGRLGLMLVMCGIAACGRGNQIDPVEVSRSDSSAVDGAGRAPMDAFCGNLTDVLADPHYDFADLQVAGSARIAATADGPTFWASTITLDGAHASIAGDADIFMWTATWNGRGADAAAMADRVRGCDFRDHLVEELTTDGVVRWRGLRGLDGKTMEVLADPSGDGSDLMLVVYGKPRAAY